MSLNLLSDDPSRSTSSSISTNAPKSQAGTSSLPKQPIDSDIQSSDKFNEGDVTELTRLGFARDQVVFELRRFNGDKTQATAALFVKSLKF